MSKTKLKGNKNFYSPKIQSADEAGFRFWRSIGDLVFPQNSVFTFEDKEGILKHMPLCKCRVCKKKFYAKPSHLRLGWAHHCSLGCKNEGQKTGRWLLCATCAKQIYRSPTKLKHATISRKSFCNKSCFAIWKNKNMFVGKNHPQWKGGSWDYRTILLRGRRQVKCSKCEVRDIRALVAHHIDHNRRHNKLSNLTWLCHNCHYLEHGGKTV